jgi:RNA-directed DNA polymerase
VPKNPATAEVSRGHSISAEKKAGRRPEFVRKRQDSKMRKSKKQQKKREVDGQQALFDRHGQARPESALGVPGTTRESVAELRSRLTGQLASTEHLLEEIVSEKNLGEAYRQVRGNDGSAGTDGVDVEAFGQWLRENLEAFRNSLLKETYQVSAVRKVEIPKPNGGVRTLGIPTVSDRVVQQAIHQVLNRYYDPYFSESSYGFRPGRGAHDAIASAALHIESGHEWVVDIDLEKFFDQINHDRLMQRLSKGAGDKRLLRLINNFLKAGLMSEGLVEQRTAGTPQGGPLSPLLSNIVLDELDRELEKRGHRFCRYADDCNIYVGSEEAGKRVMASMIKFIEGKLKLRANREKSGVRHCSRVKFLGYTLMEDGKIRVADKSTERLKDKVRQVCRRNRGVKFEQIIKELNTAIIGWAAYFHKANSWLGDLRHTDGWIRRKLRCYQLKQCGRKYAVYKMLRKLGGGEGASWNAVMYAQGWWAMSLKPVVSKGMSIEWFERQGLRSIYTEMTRKR